MGSHAWTTTIITITNCECFDSPFFTYPPSISFTLNGLLPTWRWVRGIDILSTPASSSPEMSTLCLQLFSTVLGPTSYNQYTRRDQTDTAARDIQESREDEYGTLRQRSRLEQLQLQLQLLLPVTSKATATQASAMTFIQQTAGDGFLPATCCRSHRRLFNLRRGIPTRVPEGVFGHSCTTI